MVAGRTWPKGHLEAGADADLVLLDDTTLAIDTVVAGGRVLVRERRPQVFGTFERPPDT